MMIVALDDDAVAFVSVSVATADTRTDAKTFVHLGTKLIQTNLIRSP